MSRIVRLSMLLMLVVVMTVGYRSAWRRDNSKALAAGREFTRKGVIAMESGQWTEAEDLLAQAVKKAPEDPEARRHYAEALWKRGAKEEAILQLDRGIECGGDYEQHARLAQMCLETNQIGKATRHADRAIDLEPEQSVGWAVRARILDTQKSDHEALVAYQRARALAPNDRELLWDMARLYGRLDRARDSLTILQDLANTYTPGEEPQKVVYHLGLVCASLGRLPEAADHYIEALRRGPATPDILYSLADAQYSLGNTVESQKILHQALILNPQHEPSRAMLARLGSPPVSSTQIAGRPNTPTDR